MCICSHRKKLYGDMIQSLYEVREATAENTSKLKEKLGMSTGKTWAQWFSNRERQAMHREYCQALYSMRQKNVSEVARRVE